MTVFIIEAQLQGMCVPLCAHLFWNEKLCGYVVKKIVFKFEMFKNQNEVMLTEYDYNQALQSLNMIFDAEEGTAEAEEAQILAKLIEQYEDEHFPIEPPEPTEAIKFRLEQINIS